METTELRAKLEWIANAKPGDDFPDWMGGPAAWGAPMSEIAKATLEFFQARTEDKLMGTIPETLNISANIKVLREAVLKDYGGKDDANSQQMLVLAMAGLSLLEGFLMDVETIARKD